MMPCRRQRLAYTPRVLSAVAALLLLCLPVSSCRYFSRPKQAAPPPAEQSAKSVNNKPPSRPQRPRPAPQRAAEQAAKPDSKPAAPATPPPPQVAAPDSPKRYRLMLVGDSLMEDLGLVVYRALRDHAGLEVVLSAKHSTGLCRPQFFDWPAHLRTQVAKRPPNLVVFLIGANDGLPVWEKKRRVPLGGQAWREAYKRKMDEVVGIVRAAGAEVIWIELPAQGKQYEQCMRENQIAQREYCEQAGISALHTDELLSGEWGKFAEFGEHNGARVRLRKADGTHLTREANGKILDKLLPMVEASIHQYHAAHPETLPAEPQQTGRAKKAPLIITCPYVPPAPAEPAADSSPRTPQTI